MQRPDIAKVLFWGLLSFFAVALIFSAGMYSAASGNVVYRHSAKLVRHVSLAVDEAPVLAGVRPVHFLQHAHYPGEGVTINEVADDQLVLLSGFFEGDNQIRLITRDGSIVARWPLPASELIPEAFEEPDGPATDWNVDTHGALAMPDGSIVFNFEGYGLVRLDRCGNHEWTVYEYTHHSVERAEGGGFWVSGRWKVGSDEPEEYPPFKPPYDEATILKVSDDGAVLLEKSLVRILYEGGLGPLLSSNGRWINRAWRDSRIVHLNKIEELTSDLAPLFPGFEAGDLALSIRSFNLVLVLDPVSEEIKWWRVGPWLRQHDPEFTDRGTLMIFNNNVYFREFPNPDMRAPVTVPRVSNIIEITPSTDEYQVVYGGTEEQAMASVIRGKVEPTSAGGLLVTEFEGGRVFETDQDGRIVWQYVNRYDDDEVAEVTEGRVYPADYFEVSDWSCPNPRTAGIR